MHRDVAGEQRVLGVALEVAAADGGALEVHLRGEHHVDAVPAGLGGEHVTHLVRQVDVPRGGQRARRGEGGRRLVGGVGDAAHPGGAVGDVHGTQADAGDRCRRPETGADDQADLLLEGQGAQQVVERCGGPVSRRGLGGRAECHSECSVQTSSSSAEKETTTY